METHYIMGLHCVTNKLYEILFNIRCFWPCNSYKNLTEYLMYLVSALYIYIFDKIHEFISVILFIVSMLPKRGSMVRLFWGYC